MTTMEQAMNFLPRNVTGKVTRPSGHLGMLESMAKRLYVNRFSLPDPLAEASTAAEKAPKPRPRRGAPSKKK